ncbi:hypothetical protein D3C78_1721090 [compost metagenome]
MAYPVVPPNDKPIAQTSMDTGNGPNAANPCTLAPVPNHKITNVKTKVPMTSLIKFRIGFLIAGPVLKTAS